ncbi:MAG: alpha-mannosidase [Thermoanaerobaculia bacterium]
MRSPSKPRLYLVATSHLDSQWRWTIQTTIRHFLRKTLQDNFARFEEFPDYVLSFEGAFRYRLIEEYYPREFVRIQEAVRAGRWRLAGSMLDAPDVNLPAPESLIRHVLYGNQYFERQFGKRSLDLFLPDCFGFPWSLPTIAAHCGLKGFSSQKLIKWIRPAEIPFDLGLWEGPDGSRIVAVLDPGGYGDPLREDLSRSAQWLERLEARRRTYGPGIGYRYFGVGDRGGAPDPSSLDWLERSLEGSGAIDVVHTGSDQLFQDLRSDQREGLPVHRGELLLPTHGTGCWTSQAVLKKWNRNCEILAGAAETAAVAAEWLGGERVPGAELAEEWRRFLWHQMHDDLTGTSSPEAYRFTWNDLCLAQNRLSNLLDASVTEIARGLDTRSKGVPLVVYNALDFDREGLVDAWVELDSEPAAVRILGPGGSEVPSQVLERSGRRLRVLFPAALPPVGFAVFEAVPATASGTASPALEISERTLENDRYRVRLSADGAIESLFDKRLERELLARPLDLVLLPDHSSRWPAWEIQHQDLSAEETALDGPAETRVVEHGPVRGTIEVIRRHGRSTFRQRVSLSTGSAGNRLEISNDVDWQTRASLLKARFPIALQDATASYDMGLGFIERGVNRPAQHEVPAHEWADLSGPDWGVSILSRAKYGWDRPDAGTLRLSLLRSPKAFRRFAHQAVQDLGRHRFGFAVSSHTGPVGATTVRRAAAFNAPPIAFQARSHSGHLGQAFSLLGADNDGIRLMGLKKAEAGTRWLIRLREVRGRSSGPVLLRAAAPLREAYEVNGCEREERRVEISGDGLRLELPRFSARSYLLSPQDPPARLSPVRSRPLALDFDVEATSFHGFSGADFDGRGRSIPGELFPEEVRAGGLRFPLGRAAPGTACSLACRGQRLQLPGGDFDRLHFLAASTAADGTDGVFGWSGISDGRDTALHVPYYSGFIGQWKRFSGRFAFIFNRSTPGYLERTPVAWVAAHRHDKRVRDEVYTYCYLFLCELSIPAGTSALVLPGEPSIKLFSAVASNAGRYVLRAARHLYD